MPQFRSYPKLLRDVLRCLSNSVHREYDADTEEDHQDYYLSRIRLLDDRTVSDIVSRTHRQCQRVGVSFESYRPVTQQVVALVRRLQFLQTHPRCRDLTDSENQTRADFYSEVLPAVRKVGEELSAFHDAIVGIGLAKKGADSSREFRSLSKEIRLLSERLESAAQTPLLSSGAGTAPNPILPDKPKIEVMGASDLARHLGVAGKRNAVDQVLRKLASKRPGCRDAMENPAKGAARYLYYVDQVWPVLLERLPGWLSAEQTRGRRSTKDSDSQIA